ncbi:hypothetical protein B0A48_18140 [Cryoendolithus antarcticus]|uniref:Centrosomin N-terminal motif 1 domain-containing protein n=1 Tax=Cryoendolithus antarcticus TaxID=1507870 RepID=A0A1V8S9K6_9PEZI|nr:hypothetical protein B0A48_18140 [Cryoendolithus antarcticus]
MSGSGRDSTSSSPARRKPKKLEMRASRMSVDMKNFAMDSPSSGRADSDERARQTFERKDSELSTLPVDENSFLRDTPSYMHRSDEPSDRLVHSDSANSLDKWAMRRHLMEDESSFLPETVPAPERDANAGADDTYLELGDQERRPQSSTAKAPSSRPGSGYDRSQMSASRRQLETPQSSHMKRSANAEASDPAESLAASMSPAEAASLRSVQRNGHSFNTNGDQSMEESMRSSPPSTPNGFRSSTPENNPQVHLSPGSAGTPTARDNLSPQSRHGGSVSGSQMSTPRRLRPSFFDTRHESHQSSTSTATTSSHLSGSDTTPGVDYALQTGGARPESSSVNSSMRASNLLNRLPSMASEMSFMTRDGENFPTLSRLAGAGATPFNRDRLSTRFEETEPITPRANVSHHDAPTDTVLAQRVESIQVPETIARDFRARNPSLMPDRRPASSDGAPATVGDRPRRTLTLKEQNGKIDKLSKENFDLKLKIHFLDSALRSHSDEGLQELIDKNVQCQTDLANERKESQALRRRMRELERKAKELEDTLAEAQREKANKHIDSDDEDPTLQAEMHEEILYLRQQLDHSENEVTTLKEEMLTEKLDKRKMAEHMRSMAGNRAESNSGVQETMEMWQDLLNAETGRREQAEEDLRKLREELTSMRIERASPAVNRVDRRGLRNGTRGYGQGDNESEYTNGVNGSDSSYTMVEQLKHENADLRRDLGAQTSMLTSRNRERERLQQEIEDLKMLQRKSDGARSVAGESIFERSISRAHNRAPSRASEHTAVTEAERDDWDKKEGQLRDSNAEMKLKYQELERTHNTHLQYVTALESDFQEMEQELAEANEDLKALVAERDEALQGAEELEAEYDKLEQEAMAEIDRLEKEVQQLSAQLQDALKRHQKTSTKLEHATDGYKGLQGELRDITQSVMSLEDEKQANVRTIETLEQQVGEAEEELQRWEEKCKEFADKNRKLEVTQESLHSEITFLREEQEGDKIKIGELEDALNAAQQSIQDEQEKMRDLEDEIVQERQQRDVLENQSKEEVQKVLDDLNTESAKTKDELRKLRRNLSSKEVESSSWRQKLDELEQSLRHALGDANGTKQSWLSEIERLQRDLEQTATQLDRTKMDAADKDRLLRHRDGLLESTSLESRRLSDLLDKERGARKHDLEQFEKDSRGKASHMRTIAQHESRVLELETAYSQDKRKMSALETQYKDQLSERNTLLLALWHRLSTMCGQDWATSHALVNGEVPSAEVISRSLPNFNKNILQAVKKLESLLGDFKVRIRSTEKELKKDYQTLEHNLELRMRRMDTLERAVKDTQARLADEATIAAIQAAQNRPQANRSMSSKSIKGVNNEEANKLKSEIKLLKAELKFHRQHPSAMAQQLLNAHQHAQVGLGRDPAERRSSNATASSLNTAASPKTASPARAIMSQLLRHHSTSAVEQLPSPTGAADAPPVPPLRTQNNILIPSQPIQPSEQRWIHRLKEMERRLKAEREARLLDRRGARQRLEEGRLENEELRYRLEEERARAGSVVGEGSEYEGEEGDGVGRYARDGREESGVEGSVD